MQPAVGLEINDNVIRQVDEFTETYLYKIRNRIR